MQVYNIRAEFIPVNLDIPAKLIDKTIQANGVYNASEDGADGYSSVVVVVPDRQTVVQELNVTPSTEPQTIDVLSGIDGYGPVNVAAVTSDIDSNIKSSNIKKDVTILGTTGSVVEVHNVSLQVSPRTTTQQITPPSNYTGFSEVTVAGVTASIDANIQPGNIKEGVTILGVNGNVVELNGSTTTINPSTSSQTVAPTAPSNGFTEVTVPAVTSAIDSNIQSSNIKEGTTILGVSGSVIELDTETTTVSPTTSQQIITPTSPHNGLSQVTINAVTSDIDSNIQSSNIKSGVTILGTPGSVIESNETTLSVTPTTSAQSLTPTSPYTGFNEVSVSAVTSSIDPDIQPTNIREGVDILGVTGTAYIPEHFVDFDATRGVLSRKIQMINLDGVTIIGAYALFYMYTNGTFPEHTHIDMSNITNIRRDGCNSAFALTSNLESVDMSGVTNLAYSACCSAMFKNCTSIQSVDLSSLVQINSWNAASEMFYGCSNLTTVDLSSLKNINDMWAAQYMFQNCTSLQTIDLSSLVVAWDAKCVEQLFDGCTSLTDVDLSHLMTIGGGAQMFHGCTSLTSMTLPSLTYISQIGVCQQMFAGCTSLQTLYFPALTSSSFTGYGRTDQWKNLVQGVDGCTIHMPKNLDPQTGSTVISSLQTYPNFGGTNTVLSFDLPSTFTLTGADSVDYERNPASDTATALAWKVKHTGGMTDYNVDWTPFYTSGTADPQVGDTIYSDDACTIAVTTIGTIA